MRRRPNLCVWLPHTNPDDLFYGIACYSQKGLPQPWILLWSVIACTACKPVALTCMLWWNINAGRAVDTQWLCFNVVLMHALTEAALLNVRCFFLSSSWVWCANLFLRTLSGRFDIRPGGSSPSPPPCSCCSQQVAGFQMCQPIFINISDFSCWAVAQRNVWLRLLWISFCRMPVFLLFELFL